PAEDISARLSIGKARRAGANGARLFFTNGYLETSSLPPFLCQAENCWRQSSISSIVSKVRISPYLNYSKAVTSAFSREQIIIKTAISAATIATLRAVTE